MHNILLAILATLNLVVNLTYNMKAKFIVKKTTLRISHQNVQHVNFLYKGNMCQSIKVIIIVNALFAKIVQWLLKASFTNMKTNFCAKNVKPA